MVDLTEEEKRQVKVALEYRVHSLLSVINVYMEDTARLAYENACYLVSASRKLGVGHGDLPTFEKMWADREARQERERVDAEHQPGEVKS